MYNQDSIKLSGFSYNTFDHNNKYEIKLKYKYNGEKDLKTLQVGKANHPIFWFVESSFLLMT